MKTPYFTDETIDEKSREMLQRLEQLTVIHKADLSPPQSALLIIDMQRYFLDERSHAYVTSAVPIIARIKRLADAFNRMNLPVVLTRHINTKEDAAMLGRWWSDMITEDDELSEISPMLNSLSSTVISKTQYDAFYKTPLEEMLRGKGVNQLVICGVLSHLCVESTIRSAFVHGFAVFFPIDGSASYSKEHHFATLLNLSHGFAVPVLTEELLKILEADKSGKR